MNNNSKVAALDFSYLLMEYYKKLHITENECVVLLMLNHLLTEGNKFITIDMLSLKMTLVKNDIDDTLCSLLQKGYLVYNQKGDKLETSIDPLKSLLYDEFQRSMFLDDAKNYDLETQKKISELYKLFEKEFSRSLSPLEIQRIDEWISNGFTVNEISYALKVSAVKGKRNFKYIETVLIREKTGEDVSEEGYSLNNGIYTDDDVLKNIEILKTPWTNNDEEK